MHIAIASIVPDSLRLKLERKGVVRLLEMRVCVSARETPAPNMSTDQAHPKILAFELSIGSKN